MMRKILQSITLCFSLLLILSMCGCNKNQIKISTTCGNIVMGNGKFAYDNGCIYFTDLVNIYKYDLDAEKLSYFSAKSDDVRNLFVDDEHIFFACNGLNSITKDGKNKERIFEREHCTQLFVDGDIAYYLDFIEGNLYRRKLDSEEEVLFNNVLSYYVDEKNIFVVSYNDEGTALYISPKSNIEFAKQVLSFEPIAVFVCDDRVYLSTKSTYQLVEWYNNTETVMPMTSTYYQIVDNQIVYLDSKTFENSCFSLMCYDISTKETVTICEGVFDFNVFDELICMQCSPVGENPEYKVYNTSTKTISTMKDNESFLSMALPRRN